MKLRRNETCGYRGFDLISMDVIVNLPTVEDLYSPRNDPDPEMIPKPLNDPQIDPEMIPISLHVDPEMIPI